MRIQRTALRSSFLLTASCLPLFAFSAPPQASLAILDAKQKAGKRIFQRSCAVCHVSASSASEPYAPELVRGLVEGNEEFMAKLIADGAGDKMPGFKYTLKRAQIEEILQYLKTLDKPARTVSRERPGK